jgi:RNA polymerase sigma-70 factor (ECF subfamily)
LSITRRRVAEYVRAAGRASDREGIEAECDTFRESPALTISGDVDTVPGEAALLWRRALEVVGAECEDRDWHASWRTVVEGLPPGGVAAELGMTVQAVYQAQYRVLRRVRQMLSELESEELD